MNNNNDKSGGKRKRKHTQSNKPAKKLRQHAEDSDLDSSVEILYVRRIVQASTPVDGGEMLGVDDTIDLENETIDLVSSFSDSSEDSGMLEEESVETSTEYDSSQVSEDLETEEEEDKGKKEDSSVEWVPDTEESSSEDD